MNIYLKETLFRQGYTKKTCLEGKKKKKERKPPFRTVFSKMKANPHTNEMDVLFIFVKN